MFTRKVGLVSSIFLLCLFCPAAFSMAGETASERERAALLNQALTAVCPEAVLRREALEASLADQFPDFFLADIVDRGPPQGWVRRDVRLENKEKAVALTISAARSPVGLRRLTLELYGLDDDQPLMMVLASGDCSIQTARAIRYADSGMAEMLVHFQPDLTTIQMTEPLNPPAPDGVDPGGVTVAHIDSGVNYLLPEIASRLARDEKGEMLGVDLWDGDGRPFDGDEGRSPFFPIRHGTPVASLLVKEAPDVRLIPIRFPRPDMTKMGDAVIHAAKNGARVVAMPMGSRSIDDWTAFEEAARANPELLFIVSAGNDGRDIDQTPLYPASLDLENMVVVTSSDDFGRLAPGSNWGLAHVDLMVPAESQEVIDYRGARGVASGSSYAVPRVAALAARMLKANPNWSAGELKAALFARAVPPLERGAPRLAVGWIPNPAEDF